MSHDRNALITAYRHYTGCTHAEADRVIRGIELAHAEQQNAELLKALDAADGQHLKETQELRHSNAVLQRMLEVMPDKHMRFGVMNADGTVEEPEDCADWCYACKLDKLKATAEEWKTLEGQARNACLRLAIRHGYSGPVLGLIQSGEYAKALEVIAAEDERANRVAPTVVRIVAVEENHGKLDCCDEETAHVWVTNGVWSGRRAYLTGASPFIKAVGATVLGGVTDLVGTHFYADLPLEPPGEPEPGERLEWPNLELCPPIEEIEQRLGITRPDSQDDNDKEDESPS